LKADAMASTLVVKKAVLKAQRMVGQTADCLVEWTAEW